MRILYFSRDYTTHDHRFLSKLSESEHDVWFLRLENDQIPHETRDLPRNIRQIDWRAGQGKLSSFEDLLRLMPDFKDIIADIRPDLIHAGPVQSCGFMTALSGFHPFLLVSWASDLLVDSEKDRTWQWISHHTLDQADLFLCDSQCVINKARELAGISDDRIVKFPWGVDLQLLSEENQAARIPQVAERSDEFILLSTRSWEKIYGIDVLLEAFTLAHNQNPELKLFLLNSGTLRQEILDTIANSGLQESVYTPGIVTQEQLPGYLQSADLYVSCSYCDGTSISLLEAMAVGLPVAVTDIPGNREWVSPGINGWLAAPGDPGSFAEKIAHAIRLSREERESISRNNRDVIVSKADWNINFEKLLQAYEKLLVEGSVA